MISHEDLRAMILSPIAEHKFYPEHFDELDLHVYKTFYSDFPLGTCIYSILLECSFSCNSITEFNDRFKSFPVTLYCNFNVNRKFVMIAFCQFFRYVLFSDLLCEYVQYISIEHPRDALTKDNEYVI